MNKQHSSNNRTVRGGDGAESGSHRDPSTNNHTDRFEVETINTRFIQKKSAACISLAAGTFMAFGVANAGPLTEFEEADIHVERNATDGDTEVVITALGGDEGLERLLIRTPDKRLVLLLSSSDPTIMGIREFVFESPEPEGDAILAGYPEGTYTFRGTSVTGEKFKSTAELSHELPEPLGSYRIVY
jgi:hypothetical protein